MTVRRIFCRTPKIYLSFTELNLAVHLIYDKTKSEKKEKPKIYRTEERGFEEMSEKGEV